MACVVVKAPDPGFWRGKRVFLTGHTGFKGSWLSLWLLSLGAEVSGFALAPPTTPSLFDEAVLADAMRSSIGDVRDLTQVRTALVEAEPEIVIHMAAQPLVRLSYDQPVETFATNVMGTAHLLESVRQAPSVRAVVNVTTDKCYENREWPWGYRENEPMGGHDPYSSSKGCAELVTAAYRNSFFSASPVSLASARAGNVIGGGDWALDRLVPDVLRAFDAQRAVNLRNPQAIRPWQHVLEPLSGYLKLAEALHLGEPFAEGWNFGPLDEDARPVGWIVDRMVGLWGLGARWQHDGGLHPHEASYLKLDISKARSRLGWSPTWDLNTALAKIVEWHKGWRGSQNPRDLCMAQIAEFTTAMNGSLS